MRQTAYTVDPTGAILFPELGFVVARIADEEIGQEGLFADFPTWPEAIRELIGRTVAEKVILLSGLSSEEVLEALGPVPAEAIVVGPKATAELSLGDWTITGIHVEDATSPDPLQVEVFRSERRI
jgi:hypothetical protein